MINKISKDSLLVSTAKCIEDDIHKLEKSIQEDKLELGNILDEMESEINKNRNNIQSSHSDLLLLIDDCKRRIKYLSISNIILCIVVILKILNIF